MAMTPQKKKWKDNSLWTPGAPSSSHTIIPVTVLYYSTRMGSLKVTLWRDFPAVWTRPFEVSAGALVTRRDNTEVFFHPSAGAVKSWWLTPPAETDTNRHVPYNCHRGLEDARQRANFWTCWGTLKLLGDRLASHKVWYESIESIERDLYRESPYPGLSSPGSWAPPMWRSERADEAAGLVFHSCPRGAEVNWKPFLTSCQNLP